MIALVLSALYSQKLSIPWLLMRSSSFRSQLRSMLKTFRRSFIVLSQLFIRLHLTLHDLMNSCAVALTQCKEVSEWAEEEYTKDMIYIFWILVILDILGLILTSK